MAYYRLATETVDRGAERLIKINAREQAAVLLHAVDSCAENHTLHDVAGAQSPDLAGKHDVVRPVYFGPVIPGARQTWKRKPGTAPAVFNFKKSLGNINVGSSVLAHGAQLDEVRLGADVAHGVKQIKCGSDVVGLHKNGMLY